ncbi:MAG TPA: hypothetical protein VF508_04935, partial [Pyrinomonadaceae bacterium]
MKHRSVIAFVIVAAALFAAPQLSNDLRGLKAAFGSRLHAEIMHALLNLPVEETAPAAVPARPSETLLASGTKECPAASRARQRKGEAAAAPREGSRANVEAHDQLAMIVEPLPVSEPLSAALPTAVSDAMLDLERVVGGEVAMIIPPDAGPNPGGAARSTAAAKAAAREDVKQARASAEEVRMTFVATGLAGKGAEWLKHEEALRRLGATLPGTFEYRVAPDGSKSKVYKVKRC